MNADQTPYLHVYGQECWHDTVHIVGTRKGLEALAACIAEALDGATGECCMGSFFTTDGEGYCLQPILVKDEAAIERYRLPYTDEIAYDRRAEKIWPEEVL